MEQTAVAAAPTFYPTLRYEDAHAAIEWLEGAFGFAPVLVVPGPDGIVAHAEMSFGNGIIMLGSYRDDALGAAKSSVYTYVVNVDEHCARAAAAGAEIMRGPQDTDYGSREYSALDLEGNQWHFGSYRPAAADPRD